ncbi:hypothetical protein EYF80_033688 [Liparis tanakae]|uniref:Uncharacterized protein n=1 Tax=Liparis tanakae TaxID=230148 RepID=A0A4Z2GR39_9TELE|nr:hypothetical protein EYF80_033688 [Liparis tanakae]
MGMEPPRPRSAQGPRSAQRPRSLLREVHQSSSSLSPPS